MMRCDCERCRIRRLRRSITGWRGTLRRALRQLRHQIDVRFKTQREAFATNPDAHPIERRDRVSDR